MATAAPTQNLPLFYNAVEPLNSTQHGKMKVRTILRMPQVAQTHAIPVTVDEFSLVQRHFPIVFSVGDNPIPIALFGLNEGVNVFLDADGRPLDSSVYMPAYIRRYPFLLARLRPDSDELSLCFDPTCEGIGADEDGAPLFENGEPSEVIKGILQFNEMFEQAGARTGAFMRDLKELDLLMPGELSIQPEGAPQPFIYRGFQMVNEEKLANLRGDQLRKIHKNGMLPLLYAHIFSIAMMREIFGRQARLGLVPQPVAA